MTIKCISGVIEKLKSADSGHQHSILGTEGEGGQTVVCTSTRTSYKRQSGSTSAERMDGCMYVHTSWDATSPMVNGFHTLPLSYPIMPPPTYVQDEGLRVCVCVCVVTRAKRLYKLQLPAGIFNISATPSQKFLVPRVLVLERKSYADLMDVCVHDSPSLCIKKCRR